MTFQRKRRPGQGGVISSEKQNYRLENSMKNCGCHPWTDAESRAIAWVTARGVRPNLAATVAALAGLHGGSR